MPEFIGRPRVPDESQANIMLGQALANALGPALQQFSRMNEFRIQREMEREKERKALAAQKELLEQKSMLELDAATKEQKFKAEQSELERKSREKIADKEAMARKETAMQPETPADRFWKSEMGKLASKKIIGAQKLEPGVVAQMRAAGIDPTPFERQDWRSQLVGSLRGFYDNLAGHANTAVSAEAAQEFHRVQDPKTGKIYRIPKSGLADALKAAPGAVDLGPAQ